MGNAMFYCMPGPVFTVRVVRSDGAVLEFEHPVITKQLMKAYPGHLVVHCSQLSRTKGLGQRGKVSTMRAEDTLLPGQTYCLLQVPAQGGKTVLPNSKVSTFKSSHQRKNSIGSKNSKKVTSLRGMVVGSANDVHVCDSDIAHQLQQYVIEHTSPSPAFHRQHAHQQPGGSWRPHLDAIIESPLNSTVPPRAHHSITLSPLARQARYVPASGAANFLGAGARSVRGSTSAHLSPQLGIGKCTLVTSTGLLGNAHIIKCTGLDCD